MTFETILCARAGDSQQVLVITLNRPRQANAMLPTMARELEQAVNDGVADEHVRALVITGAGKHFCAGADAQHVRDQAERAARGQYPPEPFDGNLRALHRATLAIFNSPKPVIAAVNGSATAGGLDLALACDYRFASSSAKFGESYIKLHLPPLNGGAWLLPRTVGRSRAFRMLLTAEILDAEAARAAGLADEICPDEELLPRAVAFAAAVSRAAPALTALVKAEVKNDGTLEDALSRAYVAGVGFSQSDEYKRAVAQLPRPRGAVH